MIYYEMIYYDVGIVCICKMVANGDCCADTAEPGASLAVLQAKTLYFHYYFSYGSPAGCNSLLAGSGPRSPPRRPSPPSRCGPTPRSGWRTRWRRRARG